MAKAPIKQTSGSKPKRIKIGSILSKKDDPKSYYLKVDIFGQDSISLKKGDILNLESKQQQLDSLARNSGKLGEELVEKLTERINKIPDFVKFEVFVTKAE